MEHSSAHWEQYSWLWTPASGHGLGFETNDDTDPRKWADFWPLIEQQTPTASLLCTRLWCEHSTEVAPSSLWQAYEVCSIKSPIFPIRNLKLQGMGPPPYCHLTRAEGTSLGVLKAKAGTATTRRLPYRVSPWHVGEGFHSTPHTMGAQVPYIKCHSICM